MDCLLAQIDRHARPSLAVGHGTTLFRKCWNERLAEFETFLTAFMWSAGARARFKENPRAEAQRAGLSEEECVALENADLVGLEMAARSFARKRQLKRKEWIYVFPSGVSCAILHGPLCLVSPALNLNCVFAMPSVVKPSRTAGIILFAQQDSTFPIVSSAAKPPSVRPSGASEESGWSKTAERIRRAVG